MNIEQSPSFVVNVFGHRCSLSLIWTKIKSIEAFDDFLRVQRDIFKGDNVNVNMFLKKKLSLQTTT